MSNREKPGQNRYRKLSQEITGDNYMGSIIGKIDNLRAT